MSGSFLIRNAVRSDSEPFLNLLHTFAEWEHLEPPDAEGRVRIIHDIFDKKLVNLLVATSGGRLIGFALYFYTYSSFRARPLLYLEDIFVLEDSRHLGVGYALFKRCAEEAVKHGCCRMEWAVLTWNKKAMEFYEELGAHREDIFLYRQDSDALTNLLKGRQTGKQE